MLITEENVERYRLSYLKYLSDMGEADLPLLYDEIKAVTKAFADSDRRFNGDTASFSMKKDKGLVPELTLEKEIIRVQSVPKTLLAIDDERPKKELLSEYFEGMKACLKCRLGETRTNLVFGTGNPESQIMFVGEGPGEEEDKQGIPFVGKSGHLLDKIFAAMGLTRDDLYIGNIVKCRPPSNRDPRDDEMEICFPNLHYQISVVRPKAIVALGRIAAKGLLGLKEPMNVMREGEHFYCGIRVFPTYHPSALLRNSAYKKPTWEDIQKVMAFCDIPLPTGKKE